MKEYLELRPGVINPAFWYPVRPKKSEWNKIRKRVLQRDSFTCAYCGHRAQKFMNVHHIADSQSTALENLETICVACHAVMHIGRNLDLKVIEIWKASISQVEIVKETRAAVAQGMSLVEIKQSLLLTKGPFPPESMLYPNSLIERIGDAPRAFLDEPLCAVFVKFSQWQIE